jgi:hypothetical protein
LARNERSNVPKKVDLAAAGTKGIMIEALNCCFVEKASLN